MKPLRVLLAAAAAGLAFTAPMALLAGIDATSPELLENAAFRMEVARGNHGVLVNVQDIAAKRPVADGPYYYHAVLEGEPAQVHTLENATVADEDGKIVIRGQLAGLNLKHVLSLPSDRPILEEHIVLRNGTLSNVALKEFEVGFTLRVTDPTGTILPELAGDRWAAVPFLRRADYGESRNLPSTDAFPLERDPRDIEYDFPLRSLLDQPGFEYMPQLDVMNFHPKRVASPHRFSDGWAWIRDKRTLGVFSFNQQHMVFATVTPHDRPTGKVLRFGGACLLETTLSALRSVAPGQSVDLGVIRYQSIEGDEARLDEIEVYEAQPVSPVEAERHARSVLRRPAPLQTIPKNHPWICMGSKQYLDEAEKRILKCCEAGAVFLMFDGTWWNGPCVDERHGHPIPYRYEDHVRTCVELAQRIHAKYPKVLIEMHDMLAGGEWRRMTPVYYKYGLPGSYDENWGFELMWSPMKNLKEGTSDALYYYALGCNVPMYLHIRLDDDNQHALSLWWYASTCRHLGIGAKSKNPGIAQAQREAMKQYRQWEAFYKRGEFYGISREIHFHVLPQKMAFTVNLFNLSGTARTVGGSIDLKTLGLNPALEYVSTAKVGAVENGRYQIQVELPPWGTKVDVFSGSENIQSSRK